MGKIHTVRIPPFDDSTYWQTGKLLFLERCIANGNCILIGKFSACGGSNGHFAFNGDRGRGFFFRILRVVLINAAAADGRAAGKPIIRSCAALCGDVGGTGFGALDGDFISSFISGSVIVRFGFCAAADAGCTSAARCVLDLCVACDGHSAKAAHAAADTGTFLAALCMIDYCVAINDHSAFATNEIRSVKRRNSAAADACAIGAALCALDLCVACDGHIAIAARAATDACAAAVALCALDLCVAFDVHSAFAARAAADASTIVAAGRALDGGASFDKHLRAAIDTAADACAAVAALCFFDRCVILDGYSAGTRPTTAANTGRLFAASNSFNRCVAGNCHIAFTGVTAADAGTSAAAGRLFNNSAASNGHSCITARTTAADACAADRILLPRRVCSANGIDRSAKGIDRSAGNGNVGITARTATADTSAIGAARRGNAATGDLNFTCVIEISAANARAAIIAGSTQGTIAVGIGDGQFSAGFIGIRLFVVLQTSILVAAGQCVVAVQLNVGIAAAGHIHSGLACRAGVDLHILQGDIGRLVFVCIDGDRVPRACAGDGDVGVLTIFDVSVAVAVIFRTILIEPLGDEIAAFFSVNFNGTVDDIIRTGKSRKGHAGHHGTGESESCDPLCGNAGRGRCLFLAERHRNMPQDAHGESAIRDH